MSSDVNLRQSRASLTEMLRHAVSGAVEGIMHGEKPTPSCISCVHFDEQPELCRVYKQRPPARIIAYGCADYTDNLDVPF